MNDAGQVAGYYWNGVTYEGFIASPNPTVVAATAHVSVAGTVTATAANGVLANDTDPIPNDTLTVSAVDGQASNVGHALVGSYGTLTLNADGSFSYLADPSVPSNIIAQDIFTYAATEEAGGSATSTLTITVTQAGQTYIAGTPGQALTSGNGSVLLDGSLLQNETISAGNGNDGVIAGSNDTITLGNGIDVVNAGDSETITLGNGADTVTAGANCIITAGNGTDNVTTGSNSTIKLGNGVDTVMAGANSIITVGNGNDTVTAGTNSTIIIECAMCFRKPVRSL
jgi:VCBS repeat-containing protein